MNIVSKVKSSKSSKSSKASKLPADQNGTSTGPPAKVPKTGNESSGTPVEKEKSEMKKPIKTEREPSPGPVLAAQDGNI